MIKSKWFRVLMSVVLFVVLFDVAWFFGTRSYLRSERFLKLINTPELQFNARDGYSPWPGYFIFHSFVFSGFAEEATYQVKADSIAFHLNPFLLFAQEVSIRSLTVKNVSINVGKGPDNPAAIEVKKKQVEASEAKVKEENNGESPYWTIVFHDAFMRDVKEIRVMDWAFAGNAGIRTSFWLDTEGHFRIDDSKLTIKQVEVKRADEKLGTLEEAKVTAKVDRFSLEKDEWKSILPKIATRWELEGQLDRMDTIGGYLKQLQWLSLKGSALKAKGEIAMKEGAWKGGSHLTLNAETLRIGLLQQTIDGEGEFLWQVKDESSNHFELNFKDYTLNDGRDGEGEGFRFTLDTPNTQVVHDWDVWSSEIKLPPTQIYRLQFLQAYVPPSLPVKLENGKGTLKGHFRAGSDAKNTGGELEIAVKDLSVRYRQDLTFTGDIDSKTELTRLDLERGEFDIKESGIAISQMKFLDQKSWKGSVVMSKAQIKIEEPVHLKSHVTVEGDDLQPILAFVIKDKNFPEAFLKPFDLKKPKVEFDVMATEKDLSVKDFAAKAGDLAIKGWFDGNQAHSRAKFLLDLGPLTGGYGWNGDKTEWKISGTEKWFKESLDASR